LEKDALPPEALEARRRSAVRRRRAGERGGEEIRRSRKLNPSIRIGMQKERFLILRGERLGREGGAFDVAESRADLLGHANHRVKVFGPEECVAELVLKLEDTGESGSEVDRGDERAAIPLLFHERSEHAGVPKSVRERGLSVVLRPFDERVS